MAEDDNLLEYGIRAIVDNQAGFMGAVDQIGRAVNKFQGTIEGVAQRFTKLNSASGDAASGLGDVAGAAGEGGEAMAGMDAAGVALGVTVAAVAVAVVAAGVAVKEFVDLAERGAAFSELESGFERLTAQNHLLATTMLTELHDASVGTISDMELIRITNNALIGATGNLGEELGKRLPDLMKSAMAIANATGRSTVDVFNQLENAAKRGRIQSLALLGVYIDQKKAMDEYAKSIGKAVAQLDAQEKKTALVIAVSEGAKNAADQLGDGAVSNADKLEKVHTTVTNIMDKLAQAVQPIWGEILDGINAVLDGISAAVGPLIANVGAVISIVADIVNAFVKPAFQAVAQFLGLPKLIGGGANDFFQGAAHAIGAFASGILYGANTYVFPAIITIAQGIADLLMGLSPPPVGPLSTIDQGAANVMGAWISGFTGVSLDPVQNVAMQVAGVMGKSATEGIDQVDARLKQLDVDIQPFKNQLDLVKAQFDALKPASDAAMRSIDRQIANAQEALKAGDQQAAETIRTLDAQKATLQGYIDTQQDAIDNAQIQLSLAQAQQAVERTSLDIRKAQLGPQQAAAKAAVPKKGGGGGAPTTEDLAPVGGGTPAGTPFDIAGIGEQKQNLINSFMEGLGDTQGVLANEPGMRAGVNAAAGTTGELGKAQANITQIQGILGKINTADIGKKLGDGLSKSLGAIFDPNQPGSVLFNMVKWFNDTLDPTTGTGIFGPLNKFGDNISKILRGLPGVIGTALNPLKLSITIFWDSIFEPTTPGSIASKVVKFVNTDIPAAFKGIETTITDNFVTPVQTTIQSARDVFDKLFTTDIPNFIAGAVKNFEDFPGKLVDALKNLGTTLAPALIDPLIDAANAFLGKVQDAVRSFISGIQNVAKTIAGIFPAAKDALAGIINFDINSIVIPKLAHGAMGGVFGGGSMVVGENGPEMITSADKLAVFPAAFTRAVDRLSTVLARPMPPVMTGRGGGFGAGGGQMYNDRSINATFNGVQGPTDVMRRMATLQALG